MLVNLKPFVRRYWFSLSGMLLSMVVPWFMPFDVWTMVLWVSLCIFVTANSVNVMNYQDQRKQADQWHKMFVNERNMYAAYRMHIVKNPPGREIYRRID